MFRPASAAASEVNTSLHLVLNARDALRETTARAFYGAASPSLCSCLVPCFRLTQLSVWLGGNQSLEGKVRFNADLLLILLTEPCEWALTATGQVAERGWGHLWQHRCQ